MRRAGRALLLAVAVGGVLLLFVLPGRTWLSQSRAMATAEHRSQLLARENAALRLKASQLQDPTYVERIARAQYGLVSPGQKAFGVIPPTAAPTTTTVPIRK